MNKNALPCWSLILMLIASTWAAPSVPGDEPLPFDPLVKTGRLENGLTYYIRENPKPQKRLILRLAVKAGSVHEEDNEQGLAHMLEHMAFKGTRNFQGEQDIKSFLESIGMRWGHHVNAYTTFDETVYMLMVPTDSIQNVERAFLLLSDWADRIRFDSTALENERRVVLEEWRSMQGAGMRLLYRQMPVLFKGSKYAKRLPIGKPANLRGFKRSEIVSFYEKWYRTDRMGIVAVGDMGTDKILALIQRYLAALPAVDAPLPEQAYNVPSHAKTLYSIEADKEQRFSMASLVWKRPPLPIQTRRNFRELQIRNLFHAMMNWRFHELGRKPDAPFLQGISSHQKVVRATGLLSLDVIAHEGKIPLSAETVLCEQRRAAQHGFLESELGRQKKSMLRRMRHSVAEEGKKRSIAFANAYVRCFLDSSISMGAPADQQIMEEILPTIKVAGIQDYARTHFGSEDRVVLVTLPDKKGLKRPSVRTIKKALRRGQKKAVDPYVEEKIAGGLVDSLPPPGEIVGRDTLKRIGAIRWELSNGATVFFKPTDFKNDEIRFDSYSPGGTSIVHDSDYVSASMTSTVLGYCGWGKFDALQLSKRLTGKRVRLQGQIEDLHESVSGNCSPEDLETMLQLVHLRFTRPRKDPKAFESFMIRIGGGLKNRHLAPAAAFSDTLTSTLYRNHLRTRPMTMELLPEIKLDACLRIHRDRYADASDFAFFFVGNLDPDTLETLSKAYLASLPGLDRKEKWVDRKILPFQGIVEKSVSKGMEPQSRVAIVFSGPFEYSYRKQHLLWSLGRILQRRLQEALRDEKGGTYHVSVRPSNRQFPTGRYQIHIHFVCGPKQVDELSKAVFGEIDAFRKDGPSADNVEKEKEIQRKGEETRLKTNGFWLGQLMYCHENGIRLDRILDRGEDFAAITVESMRDMAKQCVDPKNHVKVVLYPEK